MDREGKREFVAGLAQVFAETSMVVVTRNQGLTVAEVTDLRRRMRAAGAEFKVAKNRLAKLALDGTKFDGIAPLLTGTTALAWSADPVVVAKTVVDFAKSNEKLCWSAARWEPDAGCGRGQGARGAAEPGSLRGSCWACSPRPGHAHRRRAPGTGRTACPGLRRLRQDPRTRPRQPDLRPRDPRGE